MIEQHIKWDDLRFVIAIKRSRTLSGAGRSLSLSHATVFRRLEGLEQRLGVRLFERGRDGYSPTVAGEHLCDTAERVEEEVATVERRIVGQDLKPEGTVRVTATDTICFGILMPICHAFRKQFPDIKLEIVISDQLSNLSKREADIALRSTRQPHESMLGRKLGKIAQAVYGPAGHPASSKSDPCWADYEWVGPDATLLYPQLEKWMVKNCPSERTNCRVNTLLGMREASLAGMGLTVMPCYFCDPDPRLVRIGDPLPEMESELWSLTHPDLKAVSRIRAFLDFVAGEIVRTSRLSLNLSPMS
jgi:DNA-binding transcriptional LysR family regulator